MTRLNRKIIALNIAEARAQLDEIEQLLGDASPIAEGQLQVMIEHTYHHINVAWNARHASIVRYRHMRDDDFNAWGCFPNDVELPVIVADASQRSSSSRKRARTSRPNGRRRMRRNPDGNRKQ